MTTEVTAVTRTAPGALVAGGLVVTYGPVTALTDVTLSVAPGSMIAVTGPSGAGKSTLLWTLAAALSPSEGTVRLGDTLLTERTAAARLGITLVPQGNGLAEMLTARENVLAPLLDQGVAVGEAGPRAQAALAAVGLGESGDQLIEELSGGQQQRVAVARGLAMRATVLLADEPTSDLDSANRAHVVALLRAEAQAGAVVVLATHDPEAAAEADAELALDQGAMSWARTSVPPR